MSFFSYGPLSALLIVEGDTIYACPFIFRHWQPISAAPSALLLWHERTCVSSRDSLGISTHEVRTLYPHTIAVFGVVALCTFVFHKRNRLFFSFTEVAIQICMPVNFRFSMFFFIRLCTRADLCVHREQEECTGKGTTVPLGTTPYSACCSALSCAGCAACLSSHVSPSVQKNKYALGETSAPSVSSRRFTAPL